MKDRIVVALGGNALQAKGEASAHDQKREAAVAAKQLLPIIKRGYQIVIVHGNGPQVGDILIHEEAINSKEAPTIPLDSCDAMSQGMIGYWLQQAILNELKKSNYELNVATVVTQVLVDGNDAAFKNPSKPIGPFYNSQLEAQKAANKRHLVVKQDAGRGWRRVVASPQPKAIIEKDTIEQLANYGYLVIAAGGGGIPVVSKDRELIGVEAVIDKDLTAALLADQIDAKQLIILTSVDGAKINFGLKNEVTLGKVDYKTMQKYLDDNQFAPGSMGPKVEAVIKFVKEKPGKRQAIIANLDKASQAMDGKSGTIIS